MIIYIEDQDKYVSVKSLQSKKIGFKNVENAQIKDYEPLITEDSGTSKLTWIDV